MTSPTSLSGDAFAVLRVFVRHTAKRAGDTVDLATLRSEGGTDTDQVATAIEELASGGLVALASYWPRRATPGDPSSHDAVVLTRQAETFLGRYHHSCHG